MYSFKITSELHIQKREHKLMRSIHFIQGYEFVKHAQKIWTQSILLK